MSWTGTPSMDRDMDYGRPSPPPGDVGTGPVVVVIAIPARPEYLALLRAACAHLAPALGCTLAETENLRLAVDEASGFLLRNCILPCDRGPEQEELSATFVVDGSALRIILELEAEVFVPPDGDEFGWAILTALVDDCSWCVEGATARVEIRKQRRGGRNEHADR